MSKVIMSMVKRPKIMTPKKVLVLNDVRSGLMQHYLPKTIHDVITFDLIFSILYFRPLNFRCFTICFHFTLTKNGLSTREALMQEQLQSHFVGIFYDFFLQISFNTLPISKGFVCPFVLQTETLDSICLFQHLKIKVERHFAAKIPSIFLFS